MLTKASDWTLQPDCTWSSDAATTVDILELKQTTTKLTYVTSFWAILVLKYWKISNISLLIISRASPTRTPANLEPRSEKPSVTWCSFWTPTRTSPTGQKREHRRARKTYKSLLRGRCSSRNTTPCREERRLFLSSCVEKDFSSQPDWGDWCLCDCVCVGILAVLGMREKGTKVNTLTKQQSVVQCSVLWGMKELLRHRVANKIGRRESFDRYLSTVRFANIQYATLFMPLILCFYLFGKSKCGTQPKSGGLFGCV